VSSILFNYLEELKRRHREAELKDYIMPLWLPYIPLIIAIIGEFIELIGYIAVFHTIFRYTSGYSYEAPTPSGIMAWGTLLTIGGILVFIAIILRIYVYYKWLSRWNDHYERTHLFFTALSDLTKNAGFKRASTIESRINEYKVKHNKRSAGLLAILAAIIPFVDWYVYHVLNKDFHHHSVDEKLIYTEVYEDLRDNGITLTRRPEELYVVPDRSTILYIILSIITLGLFYLYWWYTLTKDPNEHFKTHRVIEAEIIRGIEEYIKSTGEAGEGGEKII
jgi:uncharacterized membrane protein